MDRRNVPPPISSLTPVASKMGYIVPPKGTVGEHLWVCLSPMGKLLSFSGLQLDFPVILHRTMPRTEKAKLLLCAAEYETQALLLAR
jgi:hypothetical protein